MAVNETNIEQAIVMNLLGIFQAGLPKKQVRKYGKMYSTSKWTSHSEWGSRLPRMWWPLSRL